MTDRTDLASLMTLSPMCVEGSATLLQCARLLHQADVRHLPVVDAGVLSGLVTDVEVFSRVGLVGGEEAWVVFEPGPEPTAAELMVRPTVALLDEDPNEVLRRVVEPGMDAVIVVDDEGTPLGIVTEHDGLRAAADELDPALQVGDIARPQWASATPEVERRTARGILIGNRTRHLLVENGQGLQGVVSFRDLVGGAAEERLASLMSRPVSWVPPETSAVDAARQMLRERIGVLPVVSALGIMGVVDRADLIRAMLKQPVDRSRTL